jgi:alpha-L-fucosidase
MKGDSMRMDPANSGDAASSGRLAWFEQARFGMFIHWGLYALIGRGEWVLNRERIPLKDYVKLAKKFDARDYDPRAWAQLAVDAGMKYMVLTTKHHEGFCLWDSKTCKFNAVNSAARRDLVAEYVDAARDAGLKVGFYYSLADWYNPDWARGWQGDLKARNRFMEYTQALVRELMTQYGRIDILWYDLPQCYTSAEWRSVELNTMVRWLQPQIIINNRAMTTEDFGTPEQHITACPRGRMWESCMTLNRHWGYCPTDHDYKSPRAVALMLATVASGSGNMLLNGGTGNLLLNVSPDAHGKIPGASQAILRKVGQWLRIHGEAIYASQSNNLTWNLWGPTTVRGNTMYLFLEEYFGPTLTVGGLTNRVLQARMLSTGQRLRVQRLRTQTVITGLPKEPPDDVLSVVKLELDGPPDQDVSRVIGAADIFPDLPK